MNFPPKYPTKMIAYTQKKQIGTEIQQIVIFKKQKIKLGPWIALKIILPFVIALLNLIGVSAQESGMKSDSLINARLHESYRERAYLYEKQIPIIENLTKANEQTNNEANELRLSVSIVRINAEREKRECTTLQEQAQKRAKRQSRVALFRGTGIGLVAGFIIAALL